MRENSVKGGASLIKQSSACVAITAVKKSADRDTLVVRLVNLLNKNHTELISSHYNIGRAWRVNLLEERQSRLDFHEKELKVNLHPNEIASLEIDFRKN